MRHEYHARFEKTYIRPLEREDIECLRIWRNDISLNRFFSATKPVSVNDQETWYGRMLTDPDQYFFAIGHDEKTMIGALSLYEFTEEGCQIGRILIGEESERGKGYGRTAFLLTMAAGIHLLDREWFRLYVHPDNIPARAMYRKIGFCETGDKRIFPGGGFEYEMKIEREYLCDHNEEMSRIIVSDGKLDRIGELDHA